MADAGRQARTLELLKRIMTAHESEIDCGMCADHMECLADLVVNGGTPDEAMEAMQRHIECCRCCRYEFETLVAVLRAEREGDI